MRRAFVISSCTLVILASLYALSWRQRPFSSPPVVASNGLPTTKRSIPDSSQSEHLGRREHRELVLKKKASTPDDSQNITPASKSISQMLQGNDPGEREIGLDRIRNLGEQQPKVLTLGLVGWLPSMLLAKRYDDIENTCLVAILFRPQDTDSIVTEQRARVVAMLSKGEYDTALRLAKGYFNIAPINLAHQSEILMSQALHQGATDQDLVNAVSPDADAIARISIDGSAYESRIEALSHSANFNDRIASGNLCLLAGRSLDALTSFEAICHSNDKLEQKQLQTVADGISRAIHARDGTITNADTLIRALRRADLPGVNAISPPLALALTKFEHTKSIGRRLSLSSETPSSPARITLPNPSANIIAVPAVEAKSTSSFDASVETNHLPRFVMSVCKDLIGNLWIGSEAADDFSWDRGVWRYEATTGKWTQFTVKDGLGDDNAYAIACDQMGRIWVGHLNHGVSVYNGFKWQNYDVVGGANRSDSLSGPLGERVFAIKVCPVDGDVWMATNSGLSRYSDSSKQWSYYTRAEGLPSDATNAIAFDADGDLYVGTQCDGIAIARRADRYSNWQQIKRTDDLPTAPLGVGLPTNLINDLLVTKNGVVCAATAAGLAWSTDKGNSWRYERGNDWADKVRQSIKGPPEGWRKSPGAKLAEDYVTKLSQDHGDNIWLGYRSKGYGRFNIADNGNEITSLQVEKESKYITALPDWIDDLPNAGTYGQGIINVPETPTKARAPEALKYPSASNSLPTSAALPDLTKLDQTLDAIKLIDSTSSASRMFSLDDDWHTQGTWLGRVGMYWSWLAAMDNLGYGYVWGACPTKLLHSVHLGPHIVKGDIYRYWVSSFATDKDSALEMPSLYLNKAVLAGKTTWKLDREQSEFDDGGESYPVTFEGPDLWISVEIPKGIFIVSLYEVNDDAHVGHGNPSRDYRLEFRSGHDSQIIDPASSSIGTTERVTAFYGGVYKRCVVEGPLSLRIRIDRNYSFNVVTNAIMLDVPDDKLVGYQLSDQEWNEYQGQIPQQIEDYRKLMTAGKVSRSGLSPVSDIDLAKRIRDHLILIPHFNLNWWAINHHEYATYLARWCVSCNPDTKNAIPIDVQQFAFRQAGLYQQWERCCTLMRGSSYRDMDKQLRWDGISGTDSAHGYDRLRNYLETASLHQHQNLNREITQ